MEAVLLDSQSDGVIGSETNSSSFDSRATRTTPKRRQFRLLRAVRDSSLISSLSVRRQDRNDDTCVRQNNSSQERNPRKDFVAFLTILVCISLAIARTMNMTSVTSSKNYGRLKGKRVFIAANYHNNIRILDSHIREVERFIQLLQGYGATVFLSVYENGSTDGTNGTLLSWKSRLEKTAIPHRILAMNDHPTLPKRRTMLTRIKYLAGVRNYALEPLKANQFDTVLFLNDILFRARDMITLMLTNQMDYDAACAMDFNTVKFYDTWVARDVNGKIMSPYFPFVADAESQRLIRSKQPVPVRSCWNGAVAIRAQALGNIQFRAWNEGESRVMRYTNDTLNLSMVYSIKDCPVSECTLLFLDLHRQGYDSFWMNPQVRVFYTFKSKWLFDLFLFDLVHFFADALFVIPTVPRLDPFDDRILDCGISRKVVLRPWIQTLIDNKALFGAIIIILIATIGASILWIQQRQQRPYSPVKTI